MLLKMNGFNSTFLKYSDETLYPYVSEHFLTGKDAKLDVMKHIAIMDQFFMEHATRTTDKKTRLFRGMMTPYPIAEGESMIVRNFISTTKELDEVSNGHEAHGGVQRFMDEYYYENNVKPGYLPAKVTDCCAYELTLDKGIPYVDMKHSTIAVKEKEILLPRNLLITFLGEYISKSNIHVRQLQVKKSTKNQFETIPQSR